LRSPRLLLLAEKECRELLASRSYWLMLLMIGPLVGHSFITAVDLYAEASGIGGGPAALPQGLSPLDGIMVPTLGAYDLAATFLFPFVAIRMIAAEKESGALKLALQFPSGAGTQLVAKAVIVIAGWLAALSAGLIATAFWKFYGGHLYAPEILNLMLGHVLHALLISGVAVAAAALAENASSAAIVTLGFTVGTWALDFVAAGRGGLLQNFAKYTPVAALRTFEQGLLDPGVVIVLLAMGIGGFAVAASWVRVGGTWKTRAAALTAILISIGGVSMAASALRSSRDLSEDRRNSFAPADEEALRQVREPLRVTAYLAPEDPRLTDLQRSILSKLGRVLPRVEVDQVAGGKTGLFEASEDHYGEIWYEIGGRRAMSRSTIERVVLEEIYRLAEVAPPSDQAIEISYSGYPLAVRPRGAAVVFYVIWPLAVALVWWFQRRPGR